MMFGVAEDHDSNPIKIGLGRMKAQGAKIVSINPVKTGYSAIADEWIGIRPGTDGLFVLALVHELLRADCIDFDYLVRATNAPWLVIEDPGSAASRPLLARPARPADVLGRARRTPRAGERSARAPAPRRPFHSARRAFGAASLLAHRRTLSRSSLCAGGGGPEGRHRAEDHQTHRRRTCAGRIQGSIGHRRSPGPIGRGVDTKHDRPSRRVPCDARISAHSNGFQTCRALHLLQTLLGAVDTPGSWTTNRPFRGQSAGPRPSGAPGEVQPATSARIPLGFPHGPEDLLVDEEGKALRIDKAFSWEAPLAAHGLMHMVIRNAHAGDPYPIDTLFLYMSNMGWNSAMNVPATLAMLTDRDGESGEYRIPHIIYADAYWSETVAYADLVLPDTTYLERWDCISLLDRPIGSERAGRRHPPAGARARPRRPTLPGRAAGAGASLGFPA